MYRLIALAMLLAACDPTAPCTSSDAGAADVCASDADVCTTGWDCPCPVPCESDDTCAYLGIEGYCDFEPPWTPDAGSRTVHPGVCQRD